MDTTTYRRLTARDVLVVAMRGALAKAPARADEADYDALIEAIKEGPEAAGRDVILMEDRVFGWVGVSLAHPNVVITIDPDWKEINIGGRGVRWGLAGLKFAKAALRANGRPIR